MSQIKTYQDISWPISSDMTTYKDRQEVEIKDATSFQEQKVRQSWYRLGSHVGTHIDAPSHFLEHGKTIEEVQLNHLIGPCEVVDLSSVEDMIFRHDIEKIKITPKSRLLIKTKNSNFSPTAPFNPNFIAINYDAAEYLVSLEIQLIGFDYLGIERGDPEHKTHTAFMKAGIPILEGLRLAHINPGKYELLCLPLLIPGRDSAPARALIY